MGCGAGVGALGFGGEGCFAFLFKPCDEFGNPTLRDSVSPGNFVLGEFLDGDGGDDEAGFVHGSIRAMVYSYVLRQGIPMSCNHTLSARLCQPDCVSPTGK